MYHTKCKGMKLNHLCFADDMLIFSKGEYGAVIIMWRGLKSLSDASGLTTNAAKSNIFSANMEKQERWQGIQKENYHSGTWECQFQWEDYHQETVEKMSGRIRTWGSRHLSYAGRVQLVNSVLPFLLGIHFYATTNSVECRNYIWSWKVVTNRSPLIAWDKVCKPKREGGLELQNMCGM